MVQLENEYGSYGLQTNYCDVRYMTQLHDLVRQHLGKGAIHKRRHRNFLPPPSSPYHSDILKITHKLPFLPNDVSVCIRSHQ